MGPRFKISSSVQPAGPIVGHYVSSEVTSTTSAQTSYTSQSMELTLDYSMDRFVGQYLDLVLPVPGNPQISQVFCVNMHTLTPEGNPLTIVKVDGTQKTYGTTIFAVDRLSGRFHVISRNGVTPLNLYGWEAEPPFQQPQMITHWVTCQPPPQWLLQHQWWQIILVLKSHPMAPPTIRDQNPKRLYTKLEELQHQVPQRLIC